MRLKEVLPLYEIGDSFSTTPVHWQYNTARHRWYGDITDSKNVRYRIMLHTLEPKRFLPLSFQSMDIWDIGFGVILPDDSLSGNLTSFGNGSEVLSIVINETLKKLINNNNGYLPDILSFTVAVKFDNGKIADETIKRQRTYLGLGGKLLARSGYVKSYPAIASTDNTSITTVFSIHSDLNMSDVSKLSSMLSKNHDLAVSLVGHKLANSSTQNN